jgi:ADP-heptose:LPS heptosyltransferase
MTSNEIKFPVARCLGSKQTIIMPTLSTAHLSAKKVLIYRVGSLGDTVVALPAFRLVARVFPDAERRLLASFPPNAKAPPSSTVLEHTGLVHGFFRYNLGTRSVIELIRLWWQLVRWRPRVLIDLSPSSGISDAKRNALFFRLCGIPRLIGVPVTEDMQLSRPNVGLPSQSSNAQGVTFELECSRLVRNIAELGDACLDNPASWDLKLTPDEHARAAEALAPVGNRPIIAASLGTKNQANDWGRENWSALFSRLAELYPTYSLAICGAAVEAQESELAASGWRERSLNPVVNLCGVLRARETAAVFERAVLFLGHDSGPMHLAAAVQTRCVAVFSARNPPGVWFPYGTQHRVLYRRVDCEGCRLNTCIVQKKKCILSITVDEVLAQVVSVLPTASHSDALSGIGL